MDYNNQKSYSTKKNLWKWILLYVVVGVVAYGLIYYFFFAGRGGYNYNTQQYNNYEQTTPAIKSDQDLMSASESLDAADVNQIDSGLNQNEIDANAF